MDRPALPTLSNTGEHFEPTSHRSTTLLAIPGFRLRDFGIPFLGLILLIFWPSSIPLAAQANALTLTDTGNSVEVKIGNMEFTKYDYSTHAKPIFYPLLGPKQIPMSRDFPMRNTAGESHDHPHHKSMWIGHEINGVDFWTEKEGRVKLTGIKINQSNNSFVADHDWLPYPGKEGKANVIMRDKMTATFSSKPNMRIIDLAIEFSTASEDVQFVDTKEGFFALRVHPNLRGKPVTDSSPKGIMTNSAGQVGKRIWGQRARWVDYSGEINNKDCGIAVFDHPSNLRHPTTWHARDYGLLAANPFGQHHFQKKPKGAGQYNLKPGNSLRFRYRVLLHAGSWNKAQTEEIYKEFSMLPDK